MNLFKLMFLTFVGLAKQAWLFPQSVVNALKQRRQRVALDQFEAERLDRLRNPANYLGK